MALGACKEFFTLSGGLKLAIRAQDDIAHDTALSRTPISSTVFIIGHNVVRREEVGEVMEEAARAGPRSSSLLLPAIPRENPPNPLKT